jgi:hypothetical protein
VLSVTELRAAEQREREWLHATTGGVPPAGADVAPPPATERSSEVLRRLAYWAGRARFLEHLYREALTETDRLRAECRRAGVSEAELGQEVGAIPSWAAPRQAAAPSQPSTAPSGGAAGGFVVGGFYAESGPDLDGDGDVDGGLLDQLGQLLGE